MVRLESSGIKNISSLSDLHIAEIPSMEVVLCIFGFASTDPEFDTETTITMRKFAELLRQHTQLKLKIVGHGQPGAPEPLASNLAQQRAENVAREFTCAHGIPLERMVLSHCSNRKPRFSNSEKNRRVELSIITSHCSSNKAKTSKPSMFWRLGHGDPVILSR